MQYEKSVIIVFVSFPSTFVTSSVQPHWDALLSSSALLSPLSASLWCQPYSAKWDRLTAFPVLVTVSRRADVHLISPSLRQSDFETFIALVSVRDGAVSQGKCQFICPVCNTLPSLFPLPHLHPFHLTDDPPLRSLTLTLSHPCTCSHSFPLYLPGTFFILSAFSFFGFDKATPLTPSSPSP